ncbi:hypothetical protein HanPI659440_Chr06g0252121 [Helianthus annuus]|nr:hypothetical protein HanIR_Chr06g0299211 [Helianthus annuus]KAJ0781688.1 hypothetical protein HanPI659440_Chr06g0252121 [Helianthus annuus]
MNKYYTHLKQHLSKPPSLSRLYMQTTKLTQDPTQPPRPHTRPLPSHLSRLIFGNRSYSGSGPVHRPHPHNPPPLFVRTADHHHFGGGIRRRVHRRRKRERDAEKRKPHRNDGDNGGGMFLGSALV